MTDAPKLSPRQTSVLVVAVFVAGLCSIVYELLIAATSTYFLGDSIKQFSITIGLYMAAMGLGSFVSRAADGDALTRFIGVELLLGLVGGVSVPVLYFAYAYTAIYQPMMIVFIVAIGALTGLEIPLLVRAAQRHYSLEVNLSNVLSLDYLGALAATLLFPFVLLPWLGTFQSALAAGLLNIVVAILVLRTFPERVSARRRRQFGMGLVATATVLAALIVFSSQLLRPWHNAMYEDRVVYARQTPYQKIVMTRGRHDLRLFLNGNLQFSSIDEYRYHEALVLPALSMAPRRERVLVLGGGDGLGVREVLKFEDVGRVDLVDLDPAITELARQDRQIRTLNADSLADPRVTVHNDDAFRFLEMSDALYDVVIVDLPDPNNASLSRLYSREFYALLRRRLARTGVFATQATSPMFANKAFWCIARTVTEAGFETWPYHAYVPSFGDWGFVLATTKGAGLDPLDIDLQVPTRFLDAAMLPKLFDFEKDLRSPPITVSTLDRPDVLGYYLEGWKHWN